MWNARGMSGSAAPARAATALMLAGLALLTVGCGDGSALTQAAREAVADLVTGPAPTATPSAAPAPSDAPAPAPSDAPAPAASDSPAPAPSDSPAPAPSAVRCDEPTFAAASGTVGEQADALGAGDFALARGFASEAYQARVPLAAFIAIISADYAYLLARPQLQMGACLVLNDGVVLLEVGYEPGETLVYWLVAEKGRLAIDGAGPAASRPDPIAA